MGQSSGSLTTAGKPWSLRFEFILIISKECGGFVQPDALHGKADFGEEQGAKAEVGRGIGRRRVCGSFPKRHWRDPFLMGRSNA